MSKKMHQEHTEEQENTPPVSTPEQAVASQEENYANKLEEEIATLKNHLLRQLAEADNSRKRAEKEVEKAASYSISNFANDLVDVLENLYRAIDSVNPNSIAENEGMKSLFQGIEMTRNLFVDAFKKHGLVRIFPLNQPFDHNFHEAISQMESKDHQPHTVINVVQAGYMLKDKLLRPALVIVSK
jgi:molecular chaperone GrpE